MIYSLLAALSAFFFIVATDHIWKIRQWVISLCCTRAAADNWNSVQISQSLTKYLIVVVFDHN